MGKWKTNMEWEKIIQRSRYTVMVFRVFRRDYFREKKNQNIVLNKDNRSVK